MNRAATWLAGALLIFAYLWMAGDDLTMRRVESAHAAESKKHARDEARAEARRRAFQREIDEAERMTNFKASAP